MINLHIVVPGSGRGPFMSHVTALAIETQRAGVRTNITNTQGSDLIRMRTEAAYLAVAAGATHLMWIDDDMLFPPEGALLLLKHNLPLVACNYIMRSLDNPRPIAQMLDRTVVTSLDKTGLGQVDLVGFGFMLVKAEVFKRIKFPWFGHRWFHKEGAPITDFEPGKLPNLLDWRSEFEDAWFCRRCRDAGIPIMIDHTLSPRIGHWGGVVFREEGISDIYQTEHVIKVD